MFIVNRITRLANFGLATIVMLSACGPAPTIEGSQILVDPDTEILVNEQAVLKINVVVQGASPQFSWTADRGIISNPTAPSVIYTAPEDAGPDLVTVVVTAGKTTFTQTTTFNVIEPPAAPPPTATETALPAASPTSTAPPPPIACNHPAVTKNLFPQLEHVDGQFPMYGPETEPNFLCEAVYDLVHTLGGMAVHIKYENVGANFGWWGIAIKDPDSYDASQHRQLCFWAYAQQPNQSFRVKMKDKTPAPENEAGGVTTIEIANEWKQICTDISKFVDEGIEPDKMDNINLGFEQPSGSAEIWVADFEFK
jgi:hypothetical protein